MDDVAEGLLPVSFTNVVLLRILTDVNSNAEFKCISSVIKT